MSTSEWIGRFGEDLVVQLSSRLGGQRVYIPAQSPLHPCLIAVLGDRAEELRRSHAGLRVLVPHPDSMQRRLKSRKLREEVNLLISTGMPSRTVARVLGCSDRYVRKIRSADSP